MPHRNSTDLVSVLTPSERHALVRLLTGITDEMRATLEAAKPHPLVTIDTPPALLAPETPLMESYRKAAKQSIDDVRRAVTTMPTMPTIPMKIMGFGFGGEVKSPTAGKEMGFKEGEGEEAAEKKGGNKGTAAEIAGEDPGSAEAEEADEKVKSKSKSPGSKTTANVPDAQAVVEAAESASGKTTPKSSKRMSFGRKISGLAATDSALNEEERQRIMEALEHRAGAASPMDSASGESTPKSTKRMSFVHKISGLAAIDSALKEERQRILEDSELGAETPTPTEKGEKNKIPSKASTPKRMSSSRQISKTTNELPPDSKIDRLGELLDAAIETSATTEEKDSAASAEEGEKKTPSPKSSTPKKVGFNWRSVASPLASDTPDVHGLDQAVSPESTPGMLTPKPGTFNRLGFGKDASPDEEQQQPDNGEMTPKRPKLATKKSSEWRPPTSALSTAVLEVPSDAEEKAIEEKLLRVNSLQRFNNPDC